MQRMKYQLFLIFLTCVLFLCPKISVEGARNGLILWSGTIVPTLLPFLLLTSLMNKYQALHCIAYVFYPIYRRYPSLNKDLAYTIILGFFCGYPLGGKIINDLTLSGSYTKKEGQCLLAICNNVSPMFTIGYTLTSALNGQISTLAFFVCLYLPNLIYLLCCMYAFKKNECFHTHIHKSSAIMTKSMDEIIFDSLHSIFTIGIYIMIFSIGANLLTQIHDFPAFTNFFIGTLEITTGITHFVNLPYTIAEKAAVLCAISSFGGLCSIAQTWSVCKESSLSIKKYFFAKCLFAIFSYLLALFVF